MVAGRPAVLRCPDGWRDGSVATARMLEGSAAWPKAEQEET
jgi:hypothetical protein